LHRVLSSDGKREKMKILNLSVAAFCALFTSSVWAGQAGNGGFVIKCGSQVEIFDYYQARQAGLTIRPPSGFTFRSKVSDLLSRLNPADPNRSLNYNYQMDYWKPEIVTGVTLQLSSQQVADPFYQQKFGLGPVTIPNNCELILALEQLPPKSQSEHPQHPIQIREYSDVWNSLDLNTQAALAVHELFYQEYLLRNLPNQSAVSVRALNGFVGSQQMANFSRSDWNAKLRVFDFSPMFPAYSGVGNFSRDMSFPFLGEDFNVSNNDWEILGWDKGGLQGPLQICGKNYIVDAIFNNPDLPGPIESSNNTFLDGEVPQVSVLNSNSSVDFSCLNKGRSLEVQAPTIGISMCRASVGTNVLGYQVCGFSGAKLIQYDGAPLKTLGEINAEILTAQDSGHLSVEFSGSALSDIQVQENGQWVHVQDCMIDLTNDQVLWKWCKKLDQ
jgi:hypothetical protein